MAKSKRTLERNVEIRDAKYRHNLSWWEIAEGAGITESTLLRWMRQEMPDDTKARVERSIQELVRE